MAPKAITVENLYNVISQVGRGHFQSKYGYAYDGNLSKTVPPPADGKVPGANEGYASIDAVNDYRIQEYVDTRILRCVLFFTVTRRRLIHVHVVALSLDILRVYIFCDSFSRADLPFQMLLAPTSSNLVASCLGMRATIAGLFKTLRRHMKTRTLRIFTLETATLCLYGQTPA